MLIYEKREKFSKKSEKEERKRVTGEMTKCWMFNMCHRRGNRGGGSHMTTACVTCVTHAIDALSNSW